MRKPRDFRFVACMGILLLCGACPRPALYLLYNQGVYGESGGYSEFEYSHYHNQGVYGESGGYSELEYSDFFGGIQQLGDDFELGPDRTTVTHVTWWGAYRDNVPGPDDFDILIYIDNGTGMPEPWSSFEYRCGAVRREATGDLLEPWTWALDIYEYSTDIPAWTLDPGATYWLVIVNDTGRWMWCDNGSPAQGNGFGVSRDTLTGAWGSHGIDMAFQLGGIQQLGDDFALGTARTTITHVTWWGAYRDNVPGPDDFDILIYIDNGTGMPEPWSSFEYRCGAVRREATGDLFAPATWALDIYEYSVDIPAWPLDMGATYWLVIVNDTGRWMWCDNGSPAQGNGFGVSRDTLTSDWGSHGIDMAFQLWGR